jgi:hypothetical protein
MATYKAICKVKINGEFVERNVYISNANNDDDAERQAKKYMIEQLPELDFYHVTKVERL